MPYDHSITEPTCDSCLRLCDQEPEQGSDCADPEHSQNESSTKKRALIFAGLFLLLSFMVVAMFERGIDSGIATQQLLARPKMQPADNLRRARIAKWRHRTAARALPALKTFTQLNARNLFDSVDYARLSLVLFDPDHIQTLMILL